MNINMNMNIALTSDPYLTVQPSIHSMFSSEGPDVVAYPSQFTFSSGSDFIETYANYADVRELPRTMHEAVGVQLIAATLNRCGVSIPLGADTLSLDLWQVQLSDSGAGRSSLLGAVYPVLDSAGMRGLVCGESWGSEPALYQGFAERPTGLFVWGEIAERLKLLNRRDFGSAKQWLTDRYDNFSTPDAITYRRTGNGKDTPPILFSSAPRISILATSSERWFFSNLEEADSAGGFIPRWMLIRAGEPTKDVPITRKLDLESARRLGESLRHVADSLKERRASILEVESDYKAWYCETKRRFEAQPDRALAMAYFNRHRSHVVKLAVIYEVSSSMAVGVTRRSWERAVEKGRQLEHTIFELLPTGMSDSGHRLQEMEEYIERARDSGLLKSVFTRKFQRVDRRQREDWLQTLIAGERVKDYPKGTQGRMAHVLVHVNWAAKYEAQSSESSFTAAT